VKQFLKVVYGFTMAEWLMLSPATPEVTGSRLACGGISEIHFWN
jgi:hypothetical protein